MNAERETRDWLKLPSDVTVSILSRLGTVEILNNTQYVCSQWRNICKDPSMWTTIDMGNSCDVLNLDYGLQKLCFHAVDRSCGRLIDINLESIGSDQLLTYIAGRSGHLKRLRLVSCYNVSDEGLTAAVAKFPFLEDLEISYCPITKNALETIGSACPLLNSLKFNVEGCKRYFSECDDDALAIAQTMPKLRHLQLFGNKLTDNGLQAILDGCPRLESLDLRKCFNVRLGGNVEKRCVERVKHLRRPYDSTHDYEFEAQIHYASGISCIDLKPEDYDDYVEFSGDSDLSDYGDFH
ncbi:SKP1/ASK-Interacting protein 19 [Hibiscus trionum]|uniref:SKP1/ASK-Interacting protein 19 n=1 Tax=Hibiscus trionum TaxID=183268 RepID=A0A9W7MWX3_HIBTR|nr:SKP1/ASK-Interacting protein 19 [Hibiscus trionum]GMJ15688.1 SKP1/ASK-Interacting protein 19 [Hibiscus trionum]